MWIKERKDAEDPVYPARDVAFEYFKVIYRLVDFIGEEVIDEEDEEDFVPGFEAVSCIF